MSRDVWRIEKIVPGGAGMARLEGGLIGFAEGALPGELIEVRAQQLRKGHVVAKAFRVLESSPNRVEPPCPLANARCGCDLMHAAPGSQLAYKLDLVRDALSRVGKLEVLPEIEAHASPRALGYRSRLRLHVDEHGRVGYHERGSNRLLEVLSCKIARPELDRALARFRELAGAQPKEVAHFAEAELRVAPSDPVPLCHLVPRERGSRITNAFVRALAEEFRVVVGDEATEHADRWPLADGISVLVPARAFVQVNWEVNETLIEAVVSGAKRRSARTFLDLYAGVGNFALALLGAGLTGVAVESHPDAVRAAERSIAEQGLTGGRTLRDDAERAIRREPSLANVDLVVLDPPRAGAAALVPGLLQAKPPCIAYCSCDPVTLARDLRNLVGGGYVLDRLEAFDMFPGTHHVETLAWLSRSPG